MHDLRPDARRPEERRADRPCVAAARRPGGRAPRCGARGASAAAPRPARAAASPESRVAHLILDGQERARGSIGEVGRMEEMVEEAVTQAPPLASPGNPPSRSAGRSSTGRSAACRRAVAVEPTSGKPAGGPPPVDPRTMADAFQASAGTLMSREGRPSMVCTRAAAPARRRVPSGAIGTRSNVGASPLRRGCRPAPGTSGACGCRRSRPRA